MLYQCVLKVIKPDISKNKKTKQNRSPSYRSETCTHKYVVLSLVTTWSPNEVKVNEPIKFLYFVTNFSPGIIVDEGVRCRRRRSSDLV